ncbi:hypothetical protein NDU88_005338 [Pleurodeles waltl]|uniref:Uncharacterized protein n=1 Tax=Pleurodeles waltl TaxID=8319 RepID=A0AAV7RNJ1_PLEWA|nr:hypothetical protein NDU88_005338 [Pleurodeles waltl]
MFRLSKGCEKLRFALVWIYQVAMKAYLDRIGPLKGEPIVKKKGQKRKSKALVEGPSAKNRTTLRNKTETTQENIEGDRRKHERAATPLKDIIMKLQKVQVLATVESDAALNEPGTSYSNNTVIHVITTLPHVPQFSHPLRAPKNVRYQSPTYVKKDIVNPLKGVSNPSYSRSEQAFPGV